MSTPQGRSRRTLSQEDKVRGESDNVDAVATEREGKIDKPVDEEVDEVELAASRRAAFCSTHQLEDITTRCRRGRTHSRKVWTAWHLRDLLCEASARLSTIPSSRQNSQVRSSTCCTESD
jgi:hypothetical protein